MEQVERFLKYFPRKSLLILEHSDLLSEAQEVFSTVFRFLGINDRIRIKPVKVNVSKDRQEMSHEARDLLLSFYRPYNEKLFTLLEERYEW